MFEPKVNFRHLVKLTDENDEIIIPSQFICGVDRPKLNIVTNVQGRYKNYSPLELITYDPIVPNINQIIKKHLDQDKSWNILIQMLGPVGDIIEWWDIPNALLTSWEPSPLSWRGTGDAATIKLTFNICNVTFH